MEGKFRRRQSSPGATATLRWHRHQDSVVCNWWSSEELALASSGPAGDDGSASQAIRHEQRATDGALAGVTLKYTAEGEDGQGQAYLMRLYRDAACVLNMGSTDIMRSSCRGISYMHKVIASVRVTTLTTSCIMNTATVYHRVASLTKRGVGPRS